MSKAAEHVQKAINLLDNRTNDEDVEKAKIELKRAMEHAALREDA